MKKNNKLKDRDLIGFVGAPWTLLVYMINKVSPKNGLSPSFFEDIGLINNLLDTLDKFIKLHIKNQVTAGATIIQIFDSWAGLIENDFDVEIGIPRSLATSEKFLPLSDISATKS